MRLSDASDRHISSEQHVGVVAVYELTIIEPLACRYPETSGEQDGLIPRIGRSSTLAGSRVNRAGSGLQEHIVKELSEAWHADYAG